MHSTFHDFATAINKRYMELAKGELFRVFDPDDLWAHYLASFPEGSNPIYRVNTEHDCSCCRNFIKNLGRVVAVKDGEVHSIWKVEGLTGPYAVVAKAMDEFVTSRPIAGLFRTKEGQYGAEKTHEGLEDGSVKVWNHFWGKVQARHHSTTPDKHIGDFDTTLGVFRRGVTELKLQDLEQVLELIDTKALYRGEEHRAAVVGFIKLLKGYNKAGFGGELYLIEHANDKYARFRNTVIGTLVQDLADGVDLEKAVASFEKKVAPENYKRTTALITPRMVEDAMAKVGELGLRSALERRHATLADISINNVLWADADAKSVMKDNLLDSLMSEAKKQQRAKNGATEDKTAVEIGIDEFLKSVLPAAEGMDIYVSNGHARNFVTVTAPVHADAGRLFKWDNGFAWSYSGNLADSSMRAAVAAKGGRIDGPFRFTHSWNYDKRNASLMDLHVFLPGHRGHKNGIHDTYGNEERVGWNARNHRATGGVQDVDYVDAAPVGYVPVENISFPSIERMPEGTYTCKIHNWNLRQPTEGGFKAEIEVNGELFEYERLQPLKHKEWVTVAEVTLKNGQFTVKHHMPCGSAPRDIWSIQTEQLVRVQTVMLSPNYWDDQAVGNKHYFFLLEGCKTDEPARGIYNEYLNGALEPHRKVFEILGEKTKVPVADEQLSGLGFSSTRGDKVKVAVKSSKGTRNYVINF